MVTRPKTPVSTTIVDLDDDITILSNDSVNDYPITSATFNSNESENLPSPRRFLEGFLPPLEESPGSSLQTSQRNPLASQHMAGSDVDSCAGLEHEKVQQLNTSAASYALRGNEKMAIKVYNQSLRLTKKELTRMQKQLEQTYNRPEEIQVVQIVLHQEWMEVALVVAEIRTMMAILYERMGDYDRAIRCCKEARDIYQRQVHLVATKQANSETAMENLTKLSHMSEKMEEARDSFLLRTDLHEESLEIHAEIKETDDKAVKEVLWDGLFDKISAALGLELRSLGEKHPQVAETLAYLSKLHLERSENGKALVTMQQAVSVAQVSLGRSHPRTAEKYYDLARQLETAGRDKSDESKAIAYYEKAFEAYASADGDHSRLLGSILNDVGVIFIKKKKYEKAAEKFSDALVSYESPVEDNSEVFAETAQVWRNLAECYVLRQEWESAVMAFTSALNVQRDARKLFDAAKKSDSTVRIPVIVQDGSIADTLKRLGKAHAAQKEYSKSYGTLLEALTILQAACDMGYSGTDGCKDLELAERQDHVANVLYCIAEVKGEDKKKDESLKLYEEALEMRVASDNLRPKGKKQNHVHCAMCKAGIGSVHMSMDDASSAFKAFNEAIQMCRSEGLPEFHPIVQMLWEKSRAAAHLMPRQDSKGRERRKRTKERKPRRKKTDALFDDLTACSTDNGSTAKSHKSKSRPSPKDEFDHQYSGWSQTAARLERRAESKKKSGDVQGAIDSTKHVLEFRRAYLSKRHEENCDPARAQEQVARTLVQIARLKLMKEDKQEAEEYFKEALDCYKANGHSKQDDCMQEIARDLERLKWQNKAAVGKS